LLEYLYAKLPEPQVAKDDRKIEGMEQLQGIKADNYQYAEMFANQIEQASDPVFEASKHLVFANIEEADI